ncbi:MAG: hypothetical protein PX634_06695, partial [Microcystis sp. M53600_WE12]|nr:hypothetical protein [Microcystis sp. M53600_WE12]
MFSPAIIHLNEDKRNYSRRQEAGGSFILPTPHTPHPTLPFFLFPHIMPYFHPVTSVYIHIPFCRRRCFYCDFPIFVLGNRTNPATFPPVVEYVEILQEEISLSQGTGKPLETIFFGGGTPSLLP